VGHGLVQAPNLGWKGEALSAEPCSTCQTKAWKEWSDDRILRGEGIIHEMPKICDPCRERLGRIAAQYQPKEVWRPSQDGRDVLVQFLDEEKK